MTPHAMPKLKKSWTYYYMQIDRTDPWVQTELARPKSSRAPAECAVNAGAAKAAVDTAKPGPEAAGPGVGAAVAERAGGYRVVVRTPIRCRR